MGLFDDFQNIINPAGFDETAPLTIADQEAVGEAALPEEPAEAMQQLEDQVSSLQERMPGGE